MHRDPTPPLPETDLILFYGDVRRNWRSMAALGVAGIVLGVLGLLATVTLTLASVVIFGVFLVIGGVAQGIHTFRTRGWRGAILHGIIAVLYVLAGASAIMNPVGASAFLTLLLAGVILAVGILRIAMAWQMRGQRNLAWPLIGGAIAVVIGLLILVQWPSTSLWVIGLFISIELLVHGISITSVALAAREAHRQDDGDQGSPRERPFGDPHASHG